MVKLHATPRGDDEMVPEALEGSFDVGKSMTMNPNKIVKALYDLEKSPLKKWNAKLDGISVIEFCYHTQGVKGTYYLKDHLLLFVKSGIYTVRLGDQVYRMRSNEMMFIRELPRS